MVAGAWRWGVWRNPHENHRACACGRNHGRRCARRRAADVHGDGPARRRREPRGRHRCDRPAGHAASGARWQHHRGGRGQPAGGVPPGGQGAVRPAEGHRQHRTGRPNEPRARHRDHPTRQGLQGAHCGPEKAQGPNKLCQLRNRHGVPLCRAHPQRRGRSGGATRWLQRRTARGHGSARGPGRLHVRQPADVTAHDQGRQAAGPCHRRQEPLPIAARRADDARTGLPGHPVPGAGRLLRLQQAAGRSGRKTPGRHQESSVLHRRCNRS